MPTGWGAMKLTELQTSDLLLTLGYYPTAVIEGNVKWEVTLDKLMAHEFNEIVLTEILVRLEEVKAIRLQLTDARLDVGLKKLDKMEFEPKLQLVALRAAYTEALTDLANMLGLQNLRAPASTRTTAYIAMG